MQLLIYNNSQVTYLYQEDENEFIALSKENLTGYIFLPDVETKIKYFVSKKTHKIYYFHPSGYLELVI